MERILQTDAIDIAAGASRVADRPMSQDEALALALAAVMGARPGKCAVLEARHLPSDLSAFATTVT